MYRIKNDKRSIQSSEWIYVALEELMKEKEYTEITVTDIVNKANIGRTTFYRNFDTVDDVLRMKLDEKFKGLTEYLTEYYKPILTDAQPVFLKPFLRYWYINSNIIEMIIKANKTEIIKDALKNLLITYKHLFENSSNKSFSNVNFLIELKVSVVVNVLEEWIKTDKSLPPDELAEIIIAEMIESFKNGFFL